MIVMHYGETIPVGWTLCDGITVTWEGMSITPPDLRDRFIKAVSDFTQIGPINNPDLETDNSFQIREEHLPQHSHPHKAHTHSIGIEAEGIFQTSIDILTDNTPQYVKETTEEVTAVYSGDACSRSQVDINEPIEVSVYGDSGQSTSEEDTKSWTNTKFKIEPNYYAMRFIMKL